MQMQNIEYVLFTTKQNDNLEHIKSALNKNFIKLIHTMKLHDRQYEMNRLNNLLSCL